MTEREMRKVEKHGDIYQVVNPSRGLKNYSIKGLADFLIWNKGKDGENFRVICRDLEVYEDLRKYWGANNKNNKKWNKKQKYWLEWEF